MSSGVRTEMGTAAGSIWGKQQREAGDVLLKWERNSHMCYLSFGSKVCLGRCLALSHHRSLGKLCIYTRCLKAQAAACTLLLHQHVVFRFSRKHHSFVGVDEKLHGVCCSDLSLQQA